MTGRCARGHQCACIGELRGMRPGCLQWRPALSPPPVHAGEAVFWASEWQGMGGLSRAPHTTEQEARDNAAWMEGRAFPLFDRPSSGEDVEGLREKVAELIVAAQWAEKALERYDTALGLNVDEAATTALYKIKDALAALPNRGTS